MKVKIPFWASVFTVIGIVILCSLGTWQIYRLQWKTEILSRVDDAFARIHDGEVADFSIDDDMMRDDFIIGGAFIGYFLHGKELLIQSRVYDGVPGYHLITPFVVTGQERPAVILVNRGWIPLEAERSDDFTILRPEGSLTVSGMLIAPPDAKYQPENESDRNMWYRVDLKQLQDYMKIDNLEPKMLYAGGGDNNADSEAYPVSVMSKLRSNIKNNHAQYAIFWFVMAIALAAIYLARFILPQIKQS